MALADKFSCPFCRGTQSRVIDSRWNKVRRCVERWRECDTCHQRYPTDEEIRLPPAPPLHIDNL